MSNFRAAGWKWTNGYTSTGASSVAVDTTSNDHKGIIKVECNFVTASATSIGMYFYNSTNGSGTSIPITYQGWADGTSGSFTNTTSSNVQLSYWGSSGSTTSAKNAIDAQVWIDNTAQSRTIGGTPFFVQVAYNPSFNIFLQWGAAGCLLATGGGNSSTLGSIVFRPYSGVFNAKVNVHPIMGRYN